jgi:predicted XRE-type DNA-binding protein
MPPRIPARIGWQIVGLRRAGFTQNEISRDLNIQQGTVSKILRRHFCFATAVGELMLISFGYFDKCGHLVLTSFVADQMMP